MRKLKWLVPLAIASASVACTDDAQDGGVDGSSDGGDGDSTTGPDEITTTGEVSGDDGDGSTAPQDDGDDDGTTSVGTDDGEASGSGEPGDGSGSDGGSSGGIVLPIELLNDGWSTNAPVVFQGGFDAGECWASTYVPEPEHYPFAIDSVLMLVGGSERGAEDFELGVWTVDEDGVPDAEIDSAIVSLTGLDNDLDTVLLSAAAIEVPEITEGSFAVVVCLAAHDGYPAIARDEDGALDHPDRNWIRTIDGQWHPSGDLGLTGDWIMRAVILPSGG